MNLLPGGNQVAKVDGAPPQVLLMTDREALIPRATALQWRDAKRLIRMEITPGLCREPALSRATSATNSRHIKRQLCASTVSPQDTSLPCPEGA